VGVVTTMTEKKVITFLRTHSTPILVMPLMTTLVIAEITKNNVHLRSLG